MRIVSLLPAATEIVAALGLAEALVGVSHECDWPPDIRDRPRLTTTPIDPAAPSGAIDAQVRVTRASGQPVIAVDGTQLRALAPDLIITQGLCDVCAVIDGAVHRLAAAMERPATVLSLSAHDLEGIWQDIRAVGAAIGQQRQAEALCGLLRAQLAEVTSRRAAEPPRRRVVCIEWLDPLYLAGHWVPELVAAAGGQDVGAEPGSPSVPRSWAELGWLDPEIIVVMLCGMSLPRALEELERFSDPDGLALLARRPCRILDGNAYTSRPGPRVVEGAALLGAALSGAERGDLVRWSPRGGPSPG